MKKLVCLVLCVVLLCTFLVGCQDDEIGAYLEKYKDTVKDTTVEEMELDLYIIVEEGTTKTATDTVNLMINQYLEKFSTKLDIHYLTADEYEKTATDALAFTEAKNEDGTPILNEDGTPVYVSSDDRADIVLVTSKPMFDNLYENRLIANITDFYDPNNSPYRSLNTQISPALLSAVTVHEDAYSQDGVKYLGLHKYSVPNNRIVGTYDIFKLSIFSLYRAAGFQKRKLNKRYCIGKICFCIYICIKMSVKARNNVSFKFLSVTGFKLL